MPVCVLYCSEVGGFREGVGLGAPMKIKMFMKLYFFFYKCMQTIKLSQVNSSHLYLYSAFSDTNCVKATAQYQNRKIVYH